MHNKFLQLWKHERRSTFAAVNAAYERSCGRSEKATWINSKQVFSWHRDCKADIDQHSTQPAFFMWGEKIWVFSRLRGSFAFSSFGRLVFLRARTELSSEMW